MIQWMHALSKSWIATLMMGALTLSFVVWGIADVFTGVSTTAVASVDGTQIEQQDFQRAYRNFLRNQGQQMGTTITPDMAQKMGLGELALQQMISRTALDNEAAKLDLTTADSDVVQNIRSMPIFRGTLGQFDHATFTQTVENAGYTEQQFIDDVRKDMTREQLTDAVESNFMLPTGYAQALFLYINEHRAADYVLLTPDMAGDIAPPSDADLQAFIKTHADRFSTPEYRDVDYAAISPQDVMGEISVSDQQIQQYYDAHKDTYIVPEKREIEQLEFKTQAEAAAARAKIDSGTSFEALAQQQGLKPAQISLGTLAQSDLPDPDRAKAIFSLALNQVSQPIHTALGDWVLARVTKIVPGSTRTLADARDEITKALKNDLAANKLVDIVNAFSDARAGGADVQQAAKKSGMRFGHIAAVDSSGMTPAGTKADIPSDPEFLPALFRAEEGEDNDPFPTKAGNYFAVRVNGVTPPKLKPLAAVRADALAGWMAQKRGELLEQKAKALAAQATKDNSLDPIAKQLRVPIQHSPALKRDTNDTMFSAALVQDLFSAPPGGVAYAPQGLSGNYIIARVTGVTHPRLNPNDQAFIAGASRLSATIASDFSIALANQARMRQGVKVYPTAVQAVVGGGS